MRSSTSGTTFEQLVNAYKNAVTILEFPNDVQVEPKKIGSESAREVSWISLH